MEVSLFPEGLEFPELRTLSLGGRGFSKEEDPFPKLSRRFPLLRCLVVRIPRSKALDPLSSGHWENIQKLCVQYDYERENEALEEGVLNCIPGVREVFISGVSLISFASVCRTIGSLQATAITVLSLRISFVTSIDNFDFTPLGVAVPALANLESLTLIGEPKLLVRTPFWSCDFAELAATLSPLRHLRRIHFNPSVLPTDVAERLLRLAHRQEVTDVVHEHKDKYRDGTLRLAEACIGLRCVTWGVWRQMIVWDVFVARDANGAVLRLDFDPEPRMQY